MGLSGQQRKQLQSALIDAFPTIVSLEQMLSFGLNKNLRAIAGVGSLQEIAFKLIQTAEAQGWHQELVSAARQENPGNLQLQAIARELLNPPKPPSPPLPNISPQPKIDVIDDGPSNPIKQKETWENSFGMKFVLIPIGKFIMGSSEESDDQEKPAHEVMISEPFYIGETTVTQEQWKKVMEAEPWKLKGYPKDQVKDDDEHNDYPVVYVSWDDVQEFITRLNERDQFSIYRLPTEAEWEYTARAGTTTKFSFGNDQELLLRYGWFKKNAKEYACRVKTNRSNQWGLYDMHGNVWEWCQDYKHKNYEGAPLDGSAWTIGGDINWRVVRGGAFDYEADGARSAYRNFAAPFRSAPTIGFRLIRKPLPD